MATRIWSRASNKDVSSITVRSRFSRSVKMVTTVSSKEVSPDEPKDELPTQITPEDAVGAATTSKQTPKTSAGKAKKSTKAAKKSMDPALLTPEYIEEQRRLRNLKKELLKKERIAKGIEPEQDTDQSPRFIKRELVSVASNDGEQFAIKVMTYNVLAQALIRRKLFPTSGDALKWGPRSHALLSELQYYDPHIMCIQEMDYVQFLSFWRLKLEALGYLAKYHRDSSKNHGVCIFYKKEFFVCKHQSFINYDKESSGDIQPRTITQNIGLLACLEFTPMVAKKYPNLSRNGIVIGTTHLFWHPFGTYERTRQTYVVLQKAMEFVKLMDKVVDNDRGWYVLFGGDFNSQPFDTPYLSITAKPITYSDRAKTVISCSLSFQYSKNRGLKEAEADDNSEQEEGGNIEKFGRNQPKDPVPENFEATPEQLEQVQKMEQLHNDLDMRAISLYSVAYDKVDPENAGKDNDRNEPMYSNWAHAWRGLLDYIFVLTPWNKTEVFTNRIDTIEEVAQHQGIRLTKLLRLPRGEEMGEEPSGQPREGQYPSDHFCLLAEMELL